MRTLSFKVNGQKLSKDGDFSNIIRGSKRYLQCKFCFEGNDWIRHRLIAVFEANGEEHAVLLRPDKTCLVPDEATDASSIVLTVVGVLGDEIIVTNNELIEQR